MAEDEKNEVNENSGEAENKSNGAGGEPAIKVPEGPSEVSAANASAPPSAGAPTSPPTHTGTTAPNAAPDTTVIPSVATPDALAQAVESGQRIYENTYKLKPDKKFSGVGIKKTIESILDSSLSKQQYHPEKTPELCRKITQDIIAQCKKLEFDRYKYVVEVVINESKGQGVRVSSRCIWDTTTDSYVSVHRSTATMIAIVMLFACYFE